MALRPLATVQILPREAHNHLHSLNGAGSKADTHRGGRSTSRDINRMGMGHSQRCKPSTHTLSSSSSKVMAGNIAGDISTLSSSSR